MDLQAAQMASGRGLSLAKAFAIACFLAACGLLVGSLLYPDVKRSGALASSQLVAIEVTAPST